MIVLEQICVCNGTMKVLVMMFENSRGDAYFIEDVEAFPDPLPATPHLAHPTLALKNGVVRVYHVTILRDLRAGMPRCIQEADEVRTRMRDLYLVTDLYSAHVIE